MPASLRPLFLALCLALPIAAQRFVPVDQSPVSGQAFRRSSILFVGDLDGDGDPDFVDAGGTVLHNDPNRRLRAAAPGTDIPFLYPNFQTMPPLSALADLNNDGILDLLSYSDDGHFSIRLEVLRGRGNASFQPRVPASGYLGRLSPACLRDIDADGLPDLFLVGFNSSRLVRNLGGLAFADVSTTSLPPVLLTSYAVPLDFADIDRDGDLDMLTLRGSTTNELWRNNGSGAFTADPLNVLAPFGVFSRAIFFDQDQDLDADLLVLDEATGSLRLLTNNSGVFAASPIALASSLDVERVAVGDVDGDTVPDVLALAGVGQNVSIVTFGNRITSLPVIATSPAHRAPVPPLAVAPDAGQMFLLDLDRDGDLDLVFGIESMFLGDGRGGFWPWALPATPLPGYTETVLPEDLDADGDVDLLVGSRVLLQDGDGRFGLTTFVLPSDAMARALVDLDLDGDRDLIYSSRNWHSTDPLASGTGVRVGGSFSPVPFGAVPVNGELATGDLDADGLVDLVAGDGSVLRNVGGNAFVSVARLPVTTIAPVVVADFDGDGRKDVVHGLQLLRNVGSMTFVSMGLLPLQDTAVLCYDLATADFDNDGDADLAVRSYSTLLRDTQIYLQGSSGLVATSATFDPTGSNHYTVELGDVDGDGFVDVLDGSLWRNLGSGQFAFVEKLPNLSDFDRARQWALADFDGDGDIDIAGGCYDRVKLFANRRRQVRSPSVPALGDPYEVEFAVEAGWSNLPGVVLSLLALQRRTPPIPSPFGLLHLDPTTSFAGPVLTTNTSGIATLSFVVPNDPALDGLEFYWQALGQQGPSLKLSNFWRERIVR